VTTHILILLYLTVCLLTVRLPAARGGGYPTSPAALRWHQPPWWRVQALCLHRHESADWHRAWVDWRGAPSRYAGGMQFLQSTWERAGGRGEPWQWTPREQLYRAYRIWDMNFGRLGDGRGAWGEWGTAGSCGLR
jgi:hypothetical protein